MFFHGGKLGMVTGSVFYDSEGSGKRETGGKGIQGVELVLYMHTHKERKYGRGVSVSESRPVYSVFSGRDGKFRLMVPEGSFFLSVNTDTLPEGMGVEKKEYEIIAGDPDLDVAVTHITEIDTGESKKWKLNMGERLSRVPVLRNRQGNAIYGSYSLVYQGERLSGKGRQLYRRFLRNAGDESITVRCGRLSRQLAVDIRLPLVSDAERVEAAYRSGVLDRHERIRLLMYSLFDKDRLPRSFRTSGSKPLKCATIYIEQIREYISSRHADIQLAMQAREYLRASIPALDRTYVSPSGFFRIHYTISGKHAVPHYGSGTPGYIADMADAFDNVKRVTCSDRGFKQPLLESGSKTYEIYVYNLDGIYGYTSSKGYYKTGRYGTKAASYIALDNNYSAEKGFDRPRDDNMKVTAAHEFFHAVQYAYNVRADKWWKEASATWNEDELYSSVNDYVRYLDDYFSEPDRSLDEYTYSGVLFARYITENHGGYETMRKIWEAHSETSGSVNAIDTALGALKEKSGIAQAFNRFSAFTFNPGQYYREGRQWGERIKVQNEFAQYPVYSGKTNLGHLSSNYQLFKYGSLKGRKLKIAVEGTGSTRWGMKLQKRNTHDGLCDISYIEPDTSSKRLDIVVEDLNKYSEICLIPSNLDKRSDNGSYSYSAELL